MKDLICCYDSLGIVPNKYDRSIDEYLRKAELKLRMLDALKKDPKEFVFQHTGKEYEFELVEASSANSIKFYYKFMTTPLPAIYADNTTAKKIINHYYNLQKALLF